jgi:alpha-glucosidase
VVALTVRGTPFLYAGEELGLEDAMVPPERVVDPDGRDGCRAPIPWTADGDDEVGHGWPTRPWLPFPANASTHSASAQVGDPRSMHTLYRELLALRHDREVLRRGSIEFASADGDVIRFDRVLDGDRLTVLVNLGEAAAPWPDDLGTATVVLSTNPDRISAGGELAPDEATVLHP